MKVDFDNLRVLTAESYNRICRYLNVCIEDARQRGGPIVFDAEDLEDDMKELRQYIDMICVCRSDEFKDVGDCHTSYPAKKYKYARPKRHHSVWLRYEY